jgi:hypothetical protein
VREFQVSSFEFQVLSSGRGSRQPEAWSLRYFLNKFSKAARASFGRKLAGVEVSFS